MQKLWMKTDVQGEFLSFVPDSSSDQISCKFSLKSLFPGSFQAEVLKARQCFIHNLGCEKLMLSPQYACMQRFQNIFEEAMSGPRELLCKGGLRPGSVLFCMKHHPRDHGHSRRIHVFNKMWFSHFYWLKLKNWKQDIGFVSSIWLTQLCFSLIDKNNNNNKHWKCQKQFPFSNLCSCKYQDVLLLKLVALTDRTAVRGKAYLASLE